MKLNFALDSDARAFQLILVVACGFITWLALGPVLAADELETGGLNRLDMGMGLFGGLALFLFGMEQMGDGLKAAAGERMKDILARLTRTRASAAVTGALVTAVIQSSSVTTVLVVGFVSAGLMNLTQSVEFAVQAVRGDDQRAAQEVIALKGEVDRGVDAALAHQAKMLAEDDPKRLAIFRIEMELVEKLKRIHTLAKRIARGVLPPELAARAE